MSEGKRISYKSKYLEVAGKVVAKDEEIEKLTYQLSSLREGVEELRKQTELSDKETEQYLEHLKRLKAEFENYKKRMVKERQQLLCWAVEDLIKEFLPVLDDLERALDSATVSQDFSTLTQGVRMVYDHFKQLLEKKGLEEIAAIGEEFNPHVHEAVQRCESGDYPDNVVVEEMRKGYKFKDRVLRPTMVKVNKRGSSSPAESDTDHHGEGKNEDNNYR